MFDICNRIGRLQESKYNVNKAKECRKRSHIDLKVYFKVLANL